MKTISVLFMIMLMGLSACREEGPAERMGREIDDAASSAADAIDDARDEIRDATN